MSGTSNGPRNFLSMLKGLNDLKIRWKRLLKFSTFAISDVVLSFHSEVRHLKRKSKLDLKKVEIFRPPTIESANTSWML